MFIVILFIVFIVHPISSYQSDKVINNAASNSIPISTRVYWMRAANKLLSEHGICPLYPFAAVIVNHTSNGMGELVCSGINEVELSGNPNDHGEMVAINNCNKIFTARNGRYRLSPEDASQAFQQLSIYSNGESCSMCASAIRWAGFKEYIFGTSAQTLIETGWPRIKIESREIFSASVDMKPNSVFVGSVLSNETDPFFSWQYNDLYPCPLGCRRSGGSNICKAN